MRKPFNYDAIQIGAVLGQKDVLITEPGTSTSCHSCPSNAACALWNNTIRGEALTTTRSIGIVQLALEFLRCVLEWRHLETG